MEKMIQKYTERLATLKENRARTVDTNTDAENELYDQLIKQVAEFIRDTKQLNILRVSQQSELLKAYDEFAETERCWYLGTGDHTKEDFLKAFNCG